MQVDGNFFPVCFPDGRLGGARVVPTRSGWRPVDAGNLPGGSFVRTRCGLGQAALRPKRWRGARCWAMTEIKLWRSPHALPRGSNSPRRNAVKTGAKTGAFRSGTLFSGIHFGMDERPRDAWICGLFVEIAKYLFFSLGLFRAGGVKSLSHGV